MSNPTLGETARLRVFGPNWKMISTATGGIILSLLGLLTMLGLSEISRQRTTDDRQTVTLQQHATDIVRLQSDTEYIRRGVDEIRSLLQKGS